MKKSLILIGLSVALFSCKKTPTAPTLAASTYTGTSTFTGQVTKNQRYTAPVGFQGVTITISIPNDQLYPLSNSTSTMGNSIFSGVTDANGNYSIPVTTTTSGIYASVRFTAPNSVYDQVNGVIESYESTSSNFNFKAGRGTSGYITNLDNTGTVVGASTTGTAIVEGILTITDPVIHADGGGTMNVPLANYTFTMNFNADPTTGTIKAYTATTDAKGAYSITVTTSNVYNDLGVIILPDFSHTQDSVTSAGVFSVTGVAGAYSGFKSFQGGLQPNVIDNHVYLTYGSFTAN